MKVYMLNPPYYPHFGRGMRWQDVGRGGTLYYPLWLAYATAVVEEEYKMKLVDAPAWNWSKEDVIEDVKRIKPDLIVMDSSFPSLNNDLSVAEIIKENCSDAKITLVGPPASQLPEKILESNGIDIVARGEYDFTIKEIAETIEKEGSFENIKGISYKDNGKMIRNLDKKFTDSEDLDKIPFVSKVYKKHLRVEDYFLGTSLYPEVQIFAGRGCPFKCTFCSWPQTLMGRKYRIRSIQNILDELEWIQENLPQVKEVFLDDDTFTVNGRYIRAFCDEFKKRKLNVVWSCNVRVGLDYETMKKMKDANCRLLIVGYESGSDTILKNVKKGITVKDSKQFARDAKKAGLLVLGDFVVGLPGENKETIEATKRLIREVKPELLQVAPATPFPGTEFYEWCKENGYLLTDEPNEYLDNQGHQKSVISYPGLSNHEIVQAVDEMLKGHYLSLRYIPLAMRQIFRRHGLDELKRFLYSARIFIRYILNRR